MKTNEFLIKLGVYPNLKGFDYIVRAVEIVKENGHIKVTKELYPKIAEEFDTSSSKVERAMRHIVSKISKSRLEDLSFVKSPTTSEFIYYIAMKNN